MEKSVQQPLQQLVTSSGQGLLDARALWAAMVGPHRLAMAQRQRLTLRTDQSTQIHKNLGASSAYVFIGVALPADAPVTPLPVVFGSNPDLGMNQGAPYILNGQLGGGGLSVTGFMQLLQPGEDLYAQILGAAPAASPITVAKVMF